MFLKVFSIFLSFGSPAIIPLALPKKDKLQDSLSILNVSQEEQNEIKDYKRNLSINFFTKYFENINRDITVCQTDKSLSCPLFLYVENNEHDQKVVLQTVQEKSLKNVESNSLVNVGTDPFINDSYIKSKDVFYILPEKLKKKDVFLREISSIKFIDNGKLSIGLPGGEVKTFLFNIPENIKNLLKQKDYCETNSDTKQNFICNALNNDQKVIYR